MNWLQAYGLEAMDLRGADSASLARVVGEGRGELRLVTDVGFCLGSVVGSLRHKVRRGITPRPAVGDWVQIQRGTQVLVNDVLPRRSQIIRKEAGRAQRQQLLASNVDDAWIVCAVGEMNVRKLERFVSIVAQGGVRPHILLNKVDLAVDANVPLGELRRSFVGIPVVPVQAQQRGSLEPLMQQLAPQRTFVLLGSSGVGKTTLVNQLLGTAAYATSATLADGRGRHTTTGRALVRLPHGALLMDTPGLREVGLADAREGIDSAFADIAALVPACRFANCRHGQDPGCAIAAAIDRGEIERQRFEAWSHLHQEGAPVVHPPKRR